MHGEVKVAVLAWQVSQCSHTAVLSGDTDVTVKVLIIFFIFIAGLTSS